jgi:hypothetical protein
MDMIEKEWLGVAWIHMVQDNDHTRAPANIFHILLMIKSN